MKKEAVVNRFLQYVQIDTQSDEQSKNCPSTSKQRVLANILVNELKEFGLKDVSCDDNCYVYASLPANTKKNVPVIGFISHLDTSPDMSGENVKPQFIHNYDGKDIILNKENDIVLSPVDFPELTNYKGQTLITTDGTTLLGADDKAGVAEIMTAIEFLVNNPDIEHGTIKIGFTPDEEIGRGADLFDVAKFGADFAYTIDGSEIGELEFENFNAAMAVVKIQGRNVHPGMSKNKMINAMLIAMELNSMLPVNQRPEFTIGYEGFFHLIDIEGDVENCSFRYLVRDHDFENFKQKKNLFSDAVTYLQTKYKKAKIELDLKDQYYNMHEKIKPVMHIIDLAEKAMLACDIEARKHPIRGGTDGARLSFMGLPTPNIFTGGHNFHGKYEYIPVQSMKKAVEVILKIVGLIVKT